MYGCTTSSTKACSLQPPYQAMLQQPTSAELQRCDGILWKRLSEQFSSLGVQPEGLPEEALTQIYQVSHHNNLHRTVSHHCHLHI